ncbi:MAG: hypothetical protein J0L67_16445 [Cytophagales bacterium]|nr:hypothetical protein [Cytophagales bacterium]
MPELRFTLIADGSSDSTLLTVIKWLLDDVYPTIAVQRSFADFRHLPKPPQAGDIQARIDCASQYYPFDILIYHRDAESRDKGIVLQRKNEILANLVDSEIVVCVIPVEMMEAWLLISGEAIKKAAGNRGYNKDMKLPAIQAIEAVSNPKDLLHQILKQVSGLKGRRLNSFNVHQAVHLVAENISDFSSLRQLNSFRVFEKDLREAVDKIVANGN